MYVKYHHSDLLDKQIVKKSSEFKRESWSAPETSFAWGEIIALITGNLVKWTLHSTYAGAPLLGWYKFTCTVICKT